MSRYVSYRSARVTNKAATGMSPRVIEFVDRAEVHRDSLIADASILQRRGLTHNEIARRLGVTRRTVLRWLT